MRHPGGAVGLLDVAAGGQRLAAIEDADVVQAEKAAFENIVALRVLAIHPPGEVHQQLVKRGLQKLDSPASPVSFLSILKTRQQAQGCTGGLTSLNSHS